MPSRSSLSLIGLIAAIVILALLALPLAQSITPLTSSFTF